MNITLIGMPGSGKSYVGKKLAERMNYSFLELDKIIEQKHKLPLQEILDEIGEESFLKEEGEEVIYYTKNKDNLIISPGGSVIYNNDSMQHLKNISVVIYLQVPLQIIKKRIADIPRGIVGLGKKSLEEIFDERTLLYKKWANATVDASQDSKIIIENILKIISAHT